MLLAPAAAEVAEAAAPPAALDAEAAAEVASAEADATEAEAEEAVVGSTDDAKRQGVSAGHDR